MLINHKCAAVFSRSFFDPWWNCRVMCAMHISLLGLPLTLSPWIGFISFYCNLTLSSGDNIPTLVSFQTGWTVCSANKTGCPTTPSQRATGYLVNLLNKAARDRCKMSPWKWWNSITQPFPWVVVIFKHDIMFTCISVGGILDSSEFSLLHYTLIGQF